MSDIRIQKTGEPDILQTSDGRLSSGRESGSEAEAPLSSTCP